MLAGVNSRDGLGQRQSKVGHAQGRAPPGRHCQHDHAQRDHRQAYEFKHQRVHVNLPRKQNDTIVGDALSVC